MGLIEVKIKELVKASNIRLFFYFFISKKRFKFLIFNLDFESDKKNKWKLFNPPRVIDFETKIIAKQNNRSSQRW